MLVKMLNEELYTDLWRMRLKEVTKIRGLPDETSKYRLLLRHGI